MMIVSVLERDGLALNRRLAIPIGLEICFSVRGIGYDLAFRV
jgi:hypothetical protein